MNIKIKRFDKELPLPAYQSEGAACFDLYARLDTEIPARSFGRIPMNVAVEVPPGYWVMQAARSSTHKFGLIPANGLAIGDEDFCGPNDEYLFLVYNVTEEPVTITRGTRIAQMMILPRPQVSIEEVEDMTGPNRGGIGSTGHR